MSKPESTVPETLHPENLNRLIDFISQDPNTNVSPKKRRKIRQGEYTSKCSSLNQPHAEHIVVNQTALEIKCSRCRLSDAELPLRRFDFIPYIHWSNSTVPEYIQIRDNRRNSILEISLPSKEDRPDIHTAVLIEKKTRKSSEIHGRLWTQFDICLVREDNFDVVQLIVFIKWSTTASPDEILRTENRSAALTQVLNLFFPDPRASVDESWSPQDFYLSAYSPPKDDSFTESIVTPDLKFSLYPFQKRAIKWMLGREGVDMLDGGSFREYIPPTSSTGLETFLQAVDANGRACFVSHLFGIVTLDIKPFLTSNQSVKGGILSEEMGLGKTVEMLSLITLHKSPKPSSDQIYDSFAESYVHNTKATLIITPQSILQQWITEVKTHAPSLKIIHYGGAKQHQNTELSKLLFFLSESDIVITSYTVLASEIHFTQLNPEKELRRKPKYARSKSPLLMLCWWRCIIDEAQLVESGISNAAVMARIIPRVNAWCISGTPVKKDVNDLFGLLVFLRYEPFASSKHIWNVLVTSYKHEFTKLIGKLALRHSKRSVRDELNLPTQKRFVVMISFTSVEEQNYQELFKQMCDESDLDIEGKPMTKGWKIEQYTEIMRKWLARLRQTALHPQIGSMNRKALGQKDASLRTVEQVLDAMIEQTDALIRTDQRGICLLKIKRGQYFENSHKIDESLKIWTETVNDVSILVRELREELSQELLHAKFQQKNGDNGSSSVIEHSSDIADEQEDVDSTSRLGTLRNRLRAALEIEHIAKFFRAGAYFQIKSNVEITRPKSLKFFCLGSLETQGYEDAKKLRREILREITSKADRLMRKVAEKAKTRSLIAIPELSLNSLKEALETKHISEDLNELARVINAQALILIKWRDITIQNLLRPLIDEDEGLEITGNEYEESTKAQDDVVIYVQLLKIVTCDRYDALTGQVNNLIRDEVKTVTRMAKLGLGASPEKALQLLGIRDGIKPGNTNSLRGAVNELRSLFNSLKQDIIHGNSRAQKEILVVEKQIKYVQSQLNEQLKAVSALEKEVELFTSIMNTRLEYYRQLQQISDMVAPYDGSTEEKTLNKMLHDERALFDRITISKSKKRYLQYLREEAINPKEQRACVICKDKFEIGTLTVCGHQYCKECISLWWSTHRNCPVCKRKLIQADLHKITCHSKNLSIKTDDTPDQNSQKNYPQCSNSINSAIYSEICQSKLEEIKNIKLEGPTFTTKIATLARHLIWLRDSDPGARTIIFSQYKEFLHVLALALEQFRIGYSSIDRMNGIEKFKHDPSVECFLLHARAHSSGLNLINASHVILCEPLINTALELQAIARVDRIGQHQETNVWLFIVNGTVEESIYQLSVRRRMEHLDKDLSKPNSQDKYIDIEEDLEEANSLQLRQASFTSLLAKDRKAGEIVASGDLWECLFGCKRKVDP